MKHIVRKLTLLMFCLCFVSISADALPYKGKVAKKVVTKAGDLERCRRAQGSAELSINNVRARINQGGNMWYDGSTAQYFVPKDGNSTAMFCAALWIGGQDENQQLRVAALKFGQDGDDFWPGPLTVDANASVNKAVCDEWDKLYKITRAEVQAFINSFEKDPEGKPIPGTYDPETLTDVIRNWPGNGNTSLKQSKFLAPFYDQNKNGIYEYNDGDYPYYDFEGVLCPAKIKTELPAGSKYTPTPTMESDTTNPNYGTGGKMPAYNGLLVDQVLKGDETIWWIFNDKGAAHTESGSENPIGLEIRAQAFAFTMNNEINNMTFYSYEIINRSTFTLTNTFFSQWVDTDLGYAQDDYVGCDVERGLGYCYNGQKTDGPGTGAYSGNPPAVGIDFFQGPYMDPDGRDNPKVDIEAFIEKYGARELGQYCVEAGLTYADTTNVAKMKDNEKLRIILTDNAYKYKNAWYPKSKNAVDACAINGVNFGNGIVDDERFGMRRFVYYNNSIASNGEPDKASDYYNYLRGYWKDNKRMVFGGNGYNTDVEEGVYADFMFPGTSDIWGWGVRETGREDEYAGKNWSEQTAGNEPGDRRFMQSAGPFTLKPGAINYITVGIPFAQAATGGPWASVELLRTVDDKCQALFDNCFNVFEGPDAPNVVVQELDREIILYLTNEPGSNNFNEKFNEIDNTIPRDYQEMVINGSDTTYVTHEYDRNYRFEGYQIFQLADASVSVADIYDNSKARLVAQCDIENYDPAQNNAPIAELTNVTITNGYPSSQVMVSGANEGIRHSFSITEDMFATTTDKRIVNNKKYYYIAIAYAYNDYKHYNVEDATKIDGQKEPYVASRKKGDGSSIEPVMAIPHMNQAEQNGTLVQSSYGVSPEIIRIEGNGNGGMTLRLSSESVDNLFDPANTANIIQHPKYEKNYGPLNISIVDPLNVKQGDYYIRLIPNQNSPNLMDSCTWALTNVNPELALYFDGKDSVYEVTSDRPICDINEQIIFDLGISVSINNIPNVAETIDMTLTQLQYVANSLNSDAYLSSNIVYKDASKGWLYGFTDSDESMLTNWIRSGSSVPAGDDGNFISDPNSDYYYVRRRETGGEDKVALDPNSQFENVVYGTWAPYKLTSFENNHPAFSRRYFLANGETENNAWSNPLQMRSLVYNDMNNLASVDIVFTSDTSKWTRCPVIEMGTDTTVTEGRAKKFQLRRHASVDKEGNAIVDPDYPQGMGWFPGYAINLETGERLNLMFGENSSLGQYNGRDMMWNPTLAGNGSSYGGMHYVYVLGTNQFRINPQLGSITTVSPTRYDQGVWAYDILKQLDNVTGTEGSNVRIFDRVESLFASIMWVGMPAPLTQMFAQGVDEANKDKSPMLIPTDATVQIRVRKPYQLNWAGSSYDNNNKPETPMNNNYPMYQFTLGSDIAVMRGVTSIAESALDDIQVVPNPYFAFDLYEQDQIQNLVKITNLPPDCYITIYAVDGTVVRKLRGPSASLVSGGGTALTSVDWDLKNERGLQISGGVYLIHVKADGIGEKLVKWFGALRPVDLNSFQ